MNLLSMFEIIIICFQLVLQKESSQAYALLSNVDTEQKSNTLTKYIFYYRTVKSSDKEDKRKGVFMEMYCQKNGSCRSLAAF